MPEPISPAPTTATSRRSTITHLRIHEPACGEGYARPWSAHAVAAAPEAEDTDRVTGSNPYSFLFGPFVALLVVVGLALLLRWAFSSGGSLVARPVRPGTTDEYGLLVAIATPPTAEDGDLLRRTLEE